MRIGLDVRLVSTANRREHWAEKHRREGLQVALLDLRAKQDLARCELPCTVTLTRIAPRPLDDDNLAAAFKHIRDYVASQLVPATQANQHGRRGDDSDERITWRYAQERGMPKEYGVRVEVD